MITPEQINLAEPDADFDYFVSLMGDEYWAKYDLAAVRLGWEAYKAWLDTQKPRQLQAD